MFGTRSTIQAVTAAVTLGCSGQLLAAGLPLFSFDNTAQLDKTTSAQDGAVVEADAIRAYTANIARSSQQLNLTLPNGEDITLQQLGFEQTAQKTRRWYGHTETADGQKGRAVLIANGKFMHGTLHLGTDTYQIRPNHSGGHDLISTDFSQLPPDHPQEVDYLEAEPELQMQLDANASLTTSADSSAADGIPTLRALVVYTPEVASQYADVNGLIDLAIAETNDGYQNSDIDASIQIELADSQQFSINQDANYGSILNNITNNASLQALRDDALADVVVMLVTNPEACGIAWVNAGSEIPYSVVNASCATGYYSFAHEIGHLHGALHDPINSPGNNPYAYGHGYQDPAGEFRTIMAYNCPGSCTRVPYWSNPNVTYASTGKVTGTVDVSHNARVIAETAATVAAFRADPGAEPQADIAVELAGDSKTTDNSFGVFPSVINNGPLTATGITFDLTFEETLTVLEMPDDCREGTGQINCTVGQLLSDTSKVLSFRFGAEDTVKHAFDATVDGDLQDPDTSNNNASASFGGSLSIAMLAALAGLMGWRRRLV